MTSVGGVPERRMVGDGVCRKDSGVAVWVKAVTIESFTLDITRRPVL